MTLQRTSHPCTPHRHARRLPLFRLLPALVGSTLLCFSVFGHAQSEEEKRAAMNAAYRQYQEVVAQGPQFREQSIEPAREAYELALDVLGDANATTAALAINYGNALIDGDDAAEVLEHALEISENVHGRNALELVDPLMALADSATSHAEFADARRYYGRALDVVQDQDERDLFLEAIIRTQLGTTSFSMGRMDEARDHFMEARDNLQPIDNDIARFRLATVNFWIGRYEITQDNALGAIAPLQSAAEVFDRFPEARQFSVNTHSALAEVHERLGQRDQATPHVLIVGEGGTAPVLLYRPNFPGALWEEGEINLLVTVDDEGYVSSARAADSDADAALAAAAIEAVMGLRYAPRFENGNAVATNDVAYTFRFSRPPR